MIKPQISLTTFTVSLGTLGTGIEVNNFSNFKLQDARITLCALNICDGLRRTKTHRRIGRPLSIN
jgi:hypothetical protein